MSKNSGGSAFPLQCRTPYGTEHPGMTLRQWYAGKTLQTFSTVGVDCVSPERVAKICFKTADAMIKEGEKG